MISLVMANEKGKAQPEAIFVNLKYSIVGFELNTKV